MKELAIVAFGTAEKYPLVQIERIREGSAVVEGSIEAADTAEQE